ncbi:hypothetical protein RJT34_13800 [Clitoria ternatea]|uniref:Uncharacterized protein n=1 Tax=Clitoria ternatea TaxID=43366 RepID=A0AAN9JPL5_CLITE
MSKGKVVMGDHPPGFSPIPKHTAQGKQPMVDVHDPEPEPSEDEMIVFIETDEEVIVTFVVLHIYSTALHMCFVV